MKIARAHVILPFLAVGLGSYLVFRALQNGQGADEITLKQAHVLGQGRVLELGLALGAFCITIGLGVLLINLGAWLPGKAGALLRSRVLGLVVLALALLFLAMAAISGFTG